MFERLLKVVRDDLKNGKPKVEIVTLFNAAANASKMDMDFVSLELMEAAVNQDKSKSPENIARLIRQRLTMSRISSEDALSEIQKVLAQTGGFNMDQVLAEAFNIGVRTAQPTRVARVIQDRLPSRLASSSYAKLIRARLMLMGSTTEDWTSGEMLLKEGLAAFQGEPNSVRWKGDSMKEILRIQKLME